MATFPTCPTCGSVSDSGAVAACPQCNQSLNAANIWQQWMWLIQLAGIVGFMLLLHFPWPATVAIGALGAANAFLRRKAPATQLDREAIARQEQNAAHPGLLRVANFGVLLSGALFAASLIAGVVMFMNAREQWQRESAGNYHASTFRVLQSYWEKAKPGRRAGSTNAKATARGLVDGKEEWMDLEPYLGFIPKDEATVLQAVPPGTVISVYYDPDLKGDYRVRLHGATPPGAASRNAELATAKYGSAALALTGFLLLAFVRLRRFSLATG